MTAKQRGRMMTAAFVRRAGAGVYGDGRGGRGLQLRVRELSSGRLGRVWVQQVRIGGKITHLSIGKYPEVTLGEARDLCLANARAIVQGKDPRRAGIPTFAAAVEKVITLHEPTWKDGARTAGLWRGSLRDHAIPVLGSLPVSGVDSAAILAALGPIWNTKRATAKLVRQRIGAVMKWAIVQGYRQDNPAGDALTKALPRNGGSVEHRAALPHGEVSAALAKIRACNAAGKTTRLALEYLVLTACRSGEVRGARWSETDLTGRVWTIPAERTKTAREHRVPLSGRAVEVLTEARDLSDGSGIVFPSVRGGEISINAFTAMMKRLQLAAVPHGFRSSFRDWCGETGAPREVAEAALAHVVKGVEGAYARSDLFALRADLMQAWANYLAR